MTEVLVMADADALKMILEKLGSIEQGQNSLTTRMEALETATPTMVKTEQGIPEAAAVAAGLPREIKIVQSAKEKPLQLTFGDDCSPMALRLFLDHYTLAKDQNMKRGVTDWQDPEFRASCIFPNPESLQNLGTLGVEQFPSLTSDNFFLKSIFLSSMSASIKKVLQTKQMTIFLPKMNYKYFWNQFYKI